MALTLGLNHHLPLQERLVRYLKAGRVHPAILLCGTAREQAWQLARRFAQALLCPRSQSVPPFCGICSTCRRCENGLHPDLLLVQEPDEDSLKVELIRQLCHEMTLSPLEGRGKVALIQDANRLGPAAANAFLKTLEEPGENRHFILLTPTASALIPTLVSRCLQFIVPPIEGPEEMIATDKIELLSEFLRARNPHPLVTAIADKSECTNLLKFIQRELHLQSTSCVSGSRSDIFSGWSPERCLTVFQEAVKLEGRLRSHANYGLMLESFLREHV